MSRMSLNCNDSQNTSNNGEHGYASVEKKIAIMHDQLYNDDPNLASDETHSAKAYKSIATPDRIHLKEANELLKYESKKRVLNYTGNFPECDKQIKCENRTDDYDKVDIDIVISQHVPTGQLHFDAIFKDTLPEFYTILQSRNRRIVASTLSQGTGNSNDGIILNRIDPNFNQFTPSDESYRGLCPVSRQCVDTERSGDGDTILDKGQCILDIVDSQIPRLGPTTLAKHVTFQEPSIDIDECNRSRLRQRRSPDKQRCSPNKALNCNFNEADRRMKTDQSNSQTQVYYNKRYYSKGHRVENSSYSKFDTRKEKYIEKSKKENEISNSTTKRTIISFSENDLVYSSRCRYTERNDPMPKSNNVKQITILQKQNSCKKTDRETMYGKDNDTKCVKNNSKCIATNSTAQKLIESIKKQGQADDGCSTHEIINDKVNQEKLVKTKVNENKSVQINKSAKLQNVQKDTVNVNKTEQETKQKMKPKKKKKRNGKHTKVGVPLTKMELLQRQIEGGQIKSMFSRYKNEALKQIKLTKELHAGTFATKYKARYQNDVVVLSVFLDQDTSDIEAVDMAHLRNSYFIDSLKDCLTGPADSSLWLLCKFHALGDLQKLLFRDPTRHVIGEIHAQFITAGILLGVEYLHSNDIVHGNIKPSKILLNNQGFPVLTGFLKIQEQTENERRDVYTPAYAAPERFRGNRCPAIDIFSVGCVAYEILNGRTPFDGGSLDDTKDNILNMACRPVYDPELLSFAGEFFLDACLRKNSKQRFTIGENRKNINSEEWFSTLDIKHLKKQTMHSPLLVAIQLIDNCAHLTWDEKTLDYNWGRVLDVTSPDAPTLDG